jgi:hypothetical protein
MPAVPQDHKRPKAETAAEPFEFTHDGVTYTLPPASSIKAGMLRRFRKLDDLDVAFSILEEIADEDALAALDDMGIAEFNQTVSDWQSHIGVDPGKS